jgi:hypothetical protein
MRPPWFEAGPALAAAGFDPTPPTPIHPVARSLMMADKPNYAFLPRIDAVTRPIVCPDLAALARHIERGRNGQNLQLIEVEDIEYAGRMHSGVKVMLLDMANEPEACLGFAWLGGKGRDTLEPALRRARHQAEQHAADHREAA